MNDRPDYGIDAPTVIRNQLIAAAAGAAMAIAALLGWLPRVAEFEPAAGVRIGFPLLWTGVALVISCGGAALLMWRDSRVGKLKRREALLDRLALRGDERVLDLGCGRGLLLVAAARRVPRGRATGIDLWQAEDLTGNRPDVPLRNAALEGVADRVAVETADMRRLPFADGSFDAVVSRAAIHNLYAAADRAQAIAEVARVLKPGGRALIDDIRHLDEYARRFAECGCPGARLLESRLGSLLWSVLTFGSLRPNLLLVEKPRAS